MRLQQDFNYRFLFKQKFLNVLWLVCLPLSTRGSSIYCKYVFLLPRSPPPPLKANLAIFILLYRQQYATKQRINPCCSAKIHTAFPATRYSVQMYYFSAPRNLQSVVMSSVPVETLAVRALCCRRHQRTGNSEHQRSTVGTSFLCKIL